MDNDTIVKYDQSLSKYQTHIPNAKEVIRQTLFDSATYNGAAGQTELSFFQTPKGQGGKTFADTNMEIAGSLPAGKSFLIERVSIIALPSENPASASATNQFLNDIYTFGKNGQLTLFISSKDYIQEAPLMMFPPVAGIENMAAASTTVAATTISSNYASISGEPYDLSPAPLMLVPTTNFSVSLKWPTAVPLPSATDMKVFVKLHGVMYRWVQ